MVAAVLAAPPPQAAVPARHPPGPGAVMHPAVAAMMAAAGTLCLVLTVLAVALARHEIRRRDRP